MTQLPHPGPGAEPAGLAGRSSFARVTALVRNDPHLALAAAAAALLAGEWRQAEASLRWPLLAGAVGCAALAFAWRRRDNLRLVPLLCVALGFQLAWVLIHVHLGAPGDSDPLIYHREGQALLDGSYPRAEYPPGAIGLFALETWIGGGATRTANALLMIPFHLLVVAAVWLFRLRFSRWLAAGVAFWPLNLFYWEFRFDLVPTAALAVGLLLAYRGRWLPAGLVLAVGALVKWTPALAALALALWLLREHGSRAAARFAAAFVVPIAVTYAGLLAWRPTEVLYAYREQGGRGITGESLPYLPLRLAGLARPGHFVADPAAVPSWADGAAIGFQVAVLLVLLALVVRARRRTEAVALAAMLPLAFLFANRIFSPQFLVTAVAAWAVAAALVVAGTGELIALAAVVAAATIGNTVVYPTLDYATGQIPGWTLASAAAVVLGSLATAWIAVAAVRGRAARESLREDPA